MQNPRNNNCQNVLLATMYVVFIVCLVGCNASLMRVAKPQRGGEASVSLSPSAPSMTVSQPENSSAPTSASYEREVIPLERIISNTNWGVAVREKYTTTLGEHQSDEARSGYTGVQKTAAILKAQSPIMYAGIALIVAALAMSYFQAKFPAVFTPGLKLISLTFLTGLCLVILPAMTQNKTILIMALLCGAGVVTAYILAKQFSSTNTETTKDNK